MIHIYLPTKACELEEIMSKIIIKIDNMFFRKRRTPKQILKLFFETNTTERQLKAIKKSSLKYLTPKYPMSLQNFKIWEEKYGNEYRRLLCLLEAINNVFCLINWTREKMARGKLFWDDANETLNIAENILIFVRQDMSDLKKSIH